MFRKRKTKKRLALFILISAIVLTVCAIIFPDKNPQIGVAGRFVSDLLNGNINEVTAYLSSEAKIAARDTCPNNSPVGCVNQIIPIAWGKFESAELRYAEPLNATTWSTLILTQWSNLKGFSGDFVPVVVTVKLENGRWVVTGWRGFTLAATNDDDQRGLVRGTIQTNEFPNWK